MDQFLENDPVFNNSLGLDETFKWTEGSEDVDFNKIDREIESGIAVEVDCEKRTVEKIKQYGLEFVVSVDEYIQKSNAYVLFYRWMRKNRTWYKIGLEPYNIKSVYTKMPKTFDIDYSTLSEEISKTFDELLVLSNQE
jgi:translation elongation factor EF-1beta